MANPNTDPARQLALKVFFAVGSTALLLLILSIPLVNPVLGPLLVILLTLMVLALLKKKKPELFEALRKPKSDERNYTLQASALAHKETYRTYMMLIGLNDSSRYRIAVNDSPYVIGTDSKSNYVIEDPYVSGSHMMIEYDDSAMSRFITDLSRNGTYLNGKRLQKGQRVALQQGDTVQIGNTNFSVEYVHY